MNKTLPRLFRCSPLPTYLFMAVALPSCGDHFSHNTSPHESVNILENDAYLRLASQRQGKHPLTIRNNTPKHFLLPLLTSSPLQRHSMFFSQEVTPQNELEQHEYSLNTCKSEWSTCSENRQCCTGFCMRGWRSPIFKACRMP